MSKILVVANGYFAELETLKKEADLADIIICADGGLKYLDLINVEPTHLLGDFDSVDPDLLMRYSHIDKEVFPKKKDATDSELAIEYAMSLNPTQLVLMGMTGGRLDHELTNIHLLKTIPDKMKAVIVDSHNRIIYSDKSVELDGQVGSNISIIPISDKITGVKTFGLEYPLNSETLYLTSSRGVSNVIIDSKIKIEIISGEFLIIIAKD